MSRYQKTKPVNDDRDDLLDDLETDARDYYDQQPATKGALKKLEGRVEHLEGMANLLTQPGGPADAETLMAKAAGVFLEPDTLMQLGERQIDDPTQMGIFSSHISSGNLRAAQNLLTDLSERQQLVKAVDAAETLLDTPLNEFDNRVGLSELTARFTSVERLLASIEARLDRLETRPRPQAATVQGQQTVAKAANVTTKKRRSREEIADNLTRQIDMYIDHPATAGALSSLVQAGKFSEARPLIEKAKAAHEVERIRQERKSWNQ